MRGRGMEKTAMGKKNKGCLSKVRLQVVKQVVGVDKSVMGRGKRATIKCCKLCV
jgi:hypothetical protein